MLDARRRGRLMVSNHSLHAGGGVSQFSYFYRVAVSICGLLCKAAIEKGEVALRSALSLAPPLTNLSQVAVDGGG